LRAADLRDTAALRRAVEEPIQEASVAACEMVLPYVDAETARATRQWAAQRFECWIEFGILLPTRENDAFGEALVAGFARSGAPLAGGAARSAEDLAASLKAAGFRFVAVRSLEALSSEDDRRPLYEGELFDEDAALSLARRRYVVACAGHKARPVAAAFGVSVRPFAVGDFEDVRRCYEAQEVAHPSVTKHVKATLAKTLASTEAMAQAFGAHFWVAAVDDRIVGCVGLTTLEVTCEVKCLAVDPNFRRRCVASALLEAAENDAPRQVIELETLDCQKAALALYERHGYTILASRAVPAKAGPFDVITLQKKTARASQKKKAQEDELPDLVAYKLVDEDGAAPRLVVPYALRNRIQFRLTTSLYPRLGFVFQLGGRRYVARRRDGGGRTLPADTLVSCELRFLDPPVYSFPRRFNTFRQPSKPNLGDTCPQGGEEGPCTCSSDCVRSSPLARPRGPHRRKRPLHGPERVQFQRRERRPLVRHRRRHAGAPRQRPPQGRLETVPAVLAAARELLRRRNARAPRRTVVFHDRRLARPRPRLLPRSLTPLRRLRRLQRPALVRRRPLDDYAVQSITTQDFLAVVVLFNAGTSAGDVTLEWYARGANSKELLGVSDHTVQAMQQLCVSATFPVTWSGRRAIVADWTATGCYTDDGDSVQVGHVVQAANAPTASALTVVPTALSSSNTTEPTALPSPSPTALPCANLDDLACTSLLDALGPAVCSTALCPSCGALAGVCALSCGFCDATPIPTPPPQPTPAPLPTTACEDTPICATTLHNSTAADLCSTTFCTSCVSEGLCDRSCGFC